MTRPTRSRVLRTPLGVRRGSRVATVGRGTAQGAQGGPPSARKTAPVFVTASGRETSDGVVRGLGGADCQKG